MTSKQNVNEPLPASGLFWPHCKVCKMPWKEWGKPECKCAERSVHIRGFSDMPKETQDALAVMCQKAFEMMEAGHDFSHDVTKSMKRSIQNHDRKMQMMHSMKAASEDCQNKVITDLHEN